MGVRRQRDGGFTLIELMVTLACMAVLGAVAVPRIQGYVLEARLNAAKPYLMEIAARQRMYKIEGGKYCCTAYNATDESTLVNALPASLAETGDFCFVFICRDGKLCEATTTRAFADSTTTPEFEVWAVLRATVASSVGTYGGSCAATGLKAPPTGWVKQGVAAGREGQVVVLRYPPPPNGAAPNRAQYHDVRLIWQDGISTTDALQP